MAAVGPLPCDYMAADAKGAQRGPQMRVIARFCLTGLPIYLRCTERGPILAWNGFLLVKSGYISTLLIWALSGLTGLFSLLFLIYLVITPNYTCTDHYYIYEYSKY